MEPSAFLDKASIPSDSEVAQILGSTASLWPELKHRLAQGLGPLTEEWAFSGKKFGWTLRLKQKKRAVVYMTPLAGYFRASFALGEKAVSAAREAALPADVLDLIENAPKFPEGRAVRLEVRTRQDLAVLARIAELKMSSCDRLPSLTRCFER